jgi:hypothetical protein
VTGTDGADVIVASGRSTVDALGGDDVVCLEVGSGVPAESEEPLVVEVNAGAGGDVVSSEGLDSGWALPMVEGASTPAVPRSLAAARSPDAVLDVVTLGPPCRPSHGGGGL